MKHWENRPLNGCLFEDQPVQAAQLVGRESDALPISVDLRPYCSPIEDQGQTNSCTANAVVGALEYHQRRAGVPEVDLSRLFVYYNARKLLDCEAHDCGSFIHHALASVMAYGVCEERIWPFQPSRYSVRPSAEAYHHAQRFQAIQYGRAPLGPSAMTALAAGIPVVFGTFLPSEFYTIAAMSGEMPLPNQIQDVGEGGHAMLLVGYDRQQGYWIVRNSYGAGFGNQGYFNVPFETLAAYSVPTHFWTIGAIDPSAGIEFSHPVTPAVDGEPPSHLRIDLNQIRASLRDRLESNLAAKKAEFRARLRS